MSDEAGSGVVLEGPVVEQVVAVAAQTHHGIVRPSCVCNNITITMRRVAVPYPH